MRKLVAGILYALAGLGVLVALWVVLLILASWRLNPFDPTGRALGMSFLVVCVGPLTLTALLLAIWLAPPRRRSPPVPNAGPSRGRLVLGFVFCATAVGLAFIIAVACFGRIVEQTLFLFSPVLLLAGALFLTGVRMLIGRPRPA